MIDLNPKTAAGAVLTLTAASLTIGTLPGDNIARPIIAAVAALTVIALLFAPGGSTLIERIARRRKFARPKRLASLLYSTLGVGTVWDGGSVSMFVALRPLPFQVTCVGQTETGVETRTLPVDLIREYLVQADVHLESIRVLAAAYRTYSDDPYNLAYEGIVGETAMPESLRTIIEVRVNLSKSYQSVKARATDGSIPAGVGKAAHVVSARLERQLNVAGFDAKLLKASEIRDYHDRILAPLNDGFKDERWTYLGGPVPTVTAEPAEWSELAVERWLGVPADRMAYVLEIAADRRQHMTAGMTLAYSSDDASDLPARSLRLKLNDGEHGDRATALLPLAQTIAPPTPSLTLRSGTRFPVSLPAFGLGVFLGPEASGAGRVFLNVETGGKVLWLETPESFVHQLAARVSTTGAQVGVYADTPAWSDVTAQVPGIRIAPTGPVDVAIYHGRPPSRVPASTAVLVWAPDGAPRTATYRITADQFGVMTVVSRSTRMQFAWEAQAAEIPFITSLAA
ncbi:type VII secretion protein EccE [Rhodococcus pyridinivorans]|uniref:type VII secretion protein EccE n=1 Tax=Rhodococcus pyridinivorans TaxID=103816 RepID=UPI00265837E5|nr:type VII secretion protein EccE [Rhodococcus pyridinivorans]